MRTRNSDLAYLTGMVSKLPVLVILGATGAGKSKLALEIARKFQGEVISADSMQVYKGLDIITNKVTADEMKICQHHMIDYVSPLKNNYTVTEFRNTALPIIEDLLCRRTLPVIVGGTNYYIEALMWNFLLDTQTAKDDHAVATSGESCKKSTSSNGAQGDTSVDGFTVDSPAESRAVAPPRECCRANISSDDPKNKNRPEQESVQEKTLGRDQRTDDVYSCGCRAAIEDDESVTTEELYHRLLTIDSQTARRIHPHDRRKLLRALQVYQQTGATMSQFFEEQHSQDGAGQLSGSLRYPDPCIIWVRSEQKVLDERTDKRVHKMLEMGLLKELTDFHRTYNQQRLDDNQEADYCLGIFQSIGFKEFHRYLLLTDEDRNTEEGQKLLEQGIEDMKTATRQYARRQNRWITNRLLKRSGGNVPPVYAVDSSNPERWTQDVYEPAVAVVEAYLRGEKPSMEPLPVEENPNLKAYNRCELCDLVFVTTTDWQAHMKGRKHRKMVRRKHVLAKREQWRAEHSGELAEGSKTNPSSLAEKDLSTSSEDEDDLFLPLNTDRFTT